MPPCNTGAKNNAPLKKFEERKKLKELQKDRQSDDLKPQDTEVVDLSSMNTTNELCEHFTFDWYELTVLSLETATGNFDPKNKEEEHAATTFLTSFLRSLRLIPFVNNTSGRNGYRASLPFRSSLSEMDAIATVYHSSKESMPHLTLTGAEGQCHPIVDAFRRTGAPHIVSRVDNRMDTSKEGLMDHLIEKFHTDEGNSLLIDSGPLGRCLYLNSSQSSVRIRMYEKDLERVARNKISGDEADPHLVRIEMQVRPSSEKKFVYSSMSSADIVRSNPKMRRVIKTIAEFCEIDGAVEIVKARKITFARTASSIADHGMKQYAMSFARAALADIASDELFKSSSTDYVCFQIVDSRGDPLPDPNISPDYVVERAIENFREYMFASDVGAKVIEEAGLNLEGTYSEVSSELVRLSMRNTAKATYEQVQGLISTADILHEIGNDEAAHKICSQIIDLQEEIDSMLKFMDANFEDIFTGGFAVTEYLKASECVFASDDELTIYIDPSDETSCSLPSSEQYAFDPEHAVDPTDDSDLDFLLSDLQPEGLKKNMTEAA